MRIAVVRALQLGDMLCAVPALRAIRAAWPEAHITLVGLPWAKEFAARFSRYLDAFIEFPGFPGLPEQQSSPRRIVEFLRDVQDGQFDLAVQLHGSGSHVNELVALMGARRTAGFYRAGDFIPEPGSFVPWPAAGLEPHRLLRIVDALGIAPQGDALEFPVMDADRGELDRVPELRALMSGGRPYCLVHPGARMRSRRWLASRFAAVADALVHAGAEVILTGVQDEAPLAAAVRHAMSTRRRCTDLTGRLSLGALAALLADARVLVCNDTGVSHIAAALGTPSVVVASGSDVRRWAPADAGRHRVLWHDVPCRPCMHADCPTGHECAAGVGEREVADAALALFAGSRHEAHAI